MSNTKIDVTQIDLPGNASELLASDGTAVTVGSGLTLAGGTLTSTGGTVTGVTASSPLASSGGATPDISLTGVVGVANGGTGLSTLTTAANILVAQNASSLSSVPVSGDATIDTAGAVTVVGLQSNAVSATAPTPGQFLGWTGAAWVPADVTGGGGFGPGFVFYLEYGTAATAPAPVGSKLMDLSYSTDPQSNTGALVVPNSATQATLATFVSDLGTPGDVTIPAGLWDLALYCESSGAGNETSFRFLIQIWDGTTASTIATSDDVFITGTANVVAQYTASVFVPLTDLTSSDRLIVVIEGRRWVSNSHTITSYFQGNTISHVHTTLTAPGGTGLVKVVAGVIQTPASLLVDADVSLTANIAQSKIANLVTDLANKVNGSIAANEVAYGTGVNTIGGDSRFTWDAGTGFLDVTDGVGSFFTVEPSGLVVRVQDPSSPSVQSTVSATEFRTVDTAVGVAVSLSVAPGVPTLDSTALGVGILNVNTNELQINGAPGAVGEVLTSNGPGVAPTWTSLPGGGVTSVTASAPLASSGGASPDISLTYGAAGAGGAAFGGYVAVASTYAALATDYVINCTSGTFTVTLPTAVGIAGRIYAIKNSGSGTVTIGTTGGQTIDGGASVVISTQYASFTVMSTGANWIVI